MANPAVDGESTLEASGPLRFALGLLAAQVLLASYILFTAPLNHVSRALAVTGAAFLIGRWMGDRGGPRWNSLTTPATLMVVHLAAVLFSWGAPMKAIVLAPGVAACVVAGSLTAMWPAGRAVRSAGFRWGALGMAIGFGLGLVLLLAMGRNAMIVGPGAAAALAVVLSK